MRSILSVAAACLVLGWGSLATTLAASKKPSLKLLAIPRGGAIPLTIQFLATVRGGSDRDPKLYCADAAWDFEDSQLVDREDCPPFEEGGTIRRSYAITHTFETPGSYSVTLSLRQKKETVLLAKIRVRADRPSGVRAQPCQMRSPLPQVHRGRGVVGKSLALH